MTYTSHFFIGRLPCYLVAWHAYAGRQEYLEGTPPMTEAATSLQERATALLGLDGPVILVGRGTPVGSTSYRPETRENFASFGHILDRIARPGADEWLNILAVEHEGKNLDRALIWTLADMWHAEARS